MKLKCDPDKLPSTYIKKPVICKTPVPCETPLPEDADVGKEPTNENKRNWSLVNRGKYGSGFWWTDAQDAVLIQMRSQGKSYAEIADHLGRSKDSVRKRAKLIT